MKKYIICILAIFETIFYTFGMVLVSNFTITNKSLIFIINSITLAGISILIYFLYRFILNKLKYPLKPNLYYISLFNILFGLLVPVILMIIIPNETFSILMFTILIATFFYGILSNLFISILNYFFSKN